ncbi:hypothetical protein [Vibrio aerogenes]|uniref:hypothetical protein n=1 Tax=Vibrio aerogenes TaxID=92172 RepID=UPI0021C3B3FE|nr:hypothetical protein [Vibrio aerogenes]
MPSKGLNIGFKNIIHWRAFDSKANALVAARGVSVSFFRVLMGHHGPPLLLNITHRSRLTVLTAVRFTATRARSGAASLVAGVLKEDSHRKKAARCGIDSGRKNGPVNPEKLLTLLPGQ